MSTESKYYGPFLVKGVKPLDRKTSAGSKTFEVTYFLDDEREQTASVVLTEKNLDNLVRDERDEDEDGKALNRLRDARVYPIVGEILNVLEDYNARTGDIKFILDQTVNSINYNTDRAANKLFGVRFPEERTFLMIDDILTETNDNEETNPEGS